MRIDFFGDDIERMVEIDPLTGEVLAKRAALDIYPRQALVTSQEKLQRALERIEAELKERLAELSGNAG